MQSHPSQLCKQCGAGFAGRKDKKYCGRECEKLAYALSVRKVHEPRPCVRCQAVFTPGFAWGMPTRYCSAECKSAAYAEHRRKAKRVSKSKRRARMRGAETQAIDPLLVFARDKWRCHLCGVRTPQSLRATFDDRAPELDHIVALADGGSHTWGNVACACRKCNGLKGPRSQGQLGLNLAA